jgi:hypothetical protein
MPWRQSRRSFATPNVKSRAQGAALSILSGSRAGPTAGGVEAIGETSCGDAAQEAGRPGGSEATRRYDHLPLWSAYRRCRRTSISSPRPPVWSSSIERICTDHKGVGRISHGGPPMGSADVVASTHAATCMYEVWTDFVGDRPCRAAFRRRTALSKVRGASGGRPAIAGQANRLRATPGDQGRVAHRRGEALRRAPEVSAPQASLTRRAHVRARRDCRPTSGAPPGGGARRMPRPRASSGPAVCP